MLNAIIITISIFLSVIGLSELLHRLWMLLLRPQKPRNILIMILDDTCAAEQIAAALEDMRWNGKTNAVLLMGIDCGLSEETLSACKTIENLNEDFAITTPSKLWEDIEKRS